MNGFKPLIYNKIYMIHFVKTEVLYNVSSYNKRSIKELLEIYKCPDNFNKNNSLVVLNNI